MIFRKSVYIGTTLFVAAVMASGCATAQTNLDSQSSEFPSQKIIAIGDLHGDYTAYVDLLEQAGLINSKGKWSGGETIFVQVGDIADRGPDSLKIIEHLQKLQKQARKKGGKVIALVGNHEAMNMTGDLRYVHAGEYAAFKNSKSRKLRAKTYKANKKAIEAYYSANDPTITADVIEEQWNALTPLGKLEHQFEWSPVGDVGEWVVNNPAVVIINGNLFVHGGLSEKYSTYSVQQMNEMATTALKNQDDSETSIINDEWGPLWYRGFLPGFNRPECEAEAVDCAIERTPAEELDFVLDQFKINRMIVGHTPSTTGIKSSYGGKLLQIDTGASAYYGGTQSFLRIENGKYYAHDNGVVHELAPLTP